MFKQFILYIFLINSCFAQKWVNVTSDYINNPSFEDYYSCPQGNSVYPSIMWIDSCKFWYSPTQGTSDYFNNCSFINTSSIPVNFQGGYQNTFHGNGYCGFFAYSGFPNGYAEYIQSKLKKKLNNKNYRFSMRVNKSNVLSYGLKKIGAHFSLLNMKDYSSVYKQFNLTPTVLNNKGALNDTINWELVSGSFKAQGTEEFLTIGWFGDSYGEYGHDSAFIPDEYYFVDSLILEEQELSIKDFNVNIITPNNDGVNDIIDFLNYELSSLSFIVYNRWGSIVFSSCDTNLIWNGFNLKNELLNDGVYYYVIKAQEFNMENYIQKSNYISIIH